MGYPQPSTVYKNNKNIAFAYPLCFKKKKEGSDRATINLGTHIYVGAMYQRMKNCPKVVSVITDDQRLSSIKI